MNPVFPSEYYETRFKLEGAPDPLPKAFAIITAHNPMNRVMTPRINRKADLRLKRLLERKLLPHFRATGMSPDGTHAEPGWAVETTLPIALAITRRYKQFALWWIENSELDLVHHDGVAREGAGEFSDRLRGKETD